MAEGPPNALSTACACVETLPVLLLPVAVAPPLPTELNGAPFMPGSWPIAELLTPSEATGVPALASDVLAVPLLPNAAVPLPLAERLAHSDADLHRAVELVHAGCTFETAAEILI